MPRRIIDLSMPVHNDMMAFPRVVRPSMAMYESWEQFAERIGVSVDFLSLIERGINAPSFETIEQVARKLRIPAKALFDFGE